MSIRIPILIVIAFVAAPLSAMENGEWREVRRKNKKKTVESRRPTHPAEVVNYWSEPNGWDIAKPVKQAPVKKKPFERAAVYWLSENHPQYQEQNSVFARYPYSMEIGFYYTNADREMIQRCEYLEHKAAINGNAKELQRRIEMGGKHFDEKDLNGTPLFYGSSHGHPEAVRVLVSNDADVNSVSFHQDRTILHGIVRNRKDAFVHADDRLKQESIRHFRPTDDRLIAVVQELNVQGKLRTDLKDADGKTAIEWLEGTPVRRVNDDRFTQEQKQQDRDVLLGLLKSIDQKEK